VTPAIIRAWASWNSATALQAEQYVARFVAREQEYEAVACRIMTNFLTIAGLG
jgi:hypothetical protein